MSEVADKLFAVLVTSKQATHIFSRTRRCGYCRKIGHYAKRCPNRKRCSKCKGPGHYANTCRFTKKELERLNRSMLTKSKNQNRGGSPTDSKSQKGNMNMEKLNKAQQKALFATAFEHDNAITKHEQEIETLTVKRSDAVKAIFDAMGKGPFQVGERFVTIRSRKGMEPVLDDDGNAVIDEETGKEKRKPNGKSVFFFVNAGDNVTVI